MYVQAEDYEFRHSKGFRNCALRERRRGQLYVLGQALEEID